MNFEKHNLVDLSVFEPTLHIDIKYATENNFSGVKVYPDAKAYLIKEVALQLQKAQKEFLKENLSLKIFDAYRPFHVQEIFWKHCPGSQYLAEPVREGGQMIKGSRHSRGVTVDVTLVDLVSGNELAMPSEFDEFNDKAHRTYDRCSEVEKANAQKLEEVMHNNMFIGLPHEWWHFDYCKWDEFPLLDIPVD